jgi:hypothetical protein
MFEIFRQTSTSRQSGKMQLLISLQTFFTSTLEETTSFRIDRTTAGFKHQWMGDKSTRPVRAGFGK